MVCYSIALDSGLTVGDGVYASMSRQRGMMRGARLLLAFAMPWLIETLSWLGVFFQVLQRVRFNVHPLLPLALVASRGALC